jgi:hypothetical protein
MTMTELKERINRINKLESWVSDLFIQNKITNERFRRDLLTLDTHKYLLVRKFCDENFANNNDYFPYITIFGENDKIKMSLQALTVLENNRICVLHTNPKYQNCWGKVSLY